MNHQLGHGHHNIAWQIMRDRRFMRTVGTIDDLASEVAHFDGDVILSSEDFELIIDCPDRFAPLRLHPALRDREFTFVVYVRNQVAYAEFSIPGTDPSWDGRGVRTFRAASLL